MLLYKLHVLTTSGTCQVNESLFPSQLSKKNIELAEEAVELAVKTWGQRTLTELEAEERLSYSCEKVKNSEICLDESCKSNIWI